MARRAIVATAVAGGLAACSSETTPVGGIMVFMSIDPSVSAAKPTEFRASIGSSFAGGPSYYDGGFAIADASSSGNDARFPTSFAIDSNGDPNANVAIDLSVWRGTQQVDRQRYLIDKVPRTTVAELPVVFGSVCGASGPPPGESCPQEKNWKCAWVHDHWACNGGDLPALGADAGWFAPSSGGDATSEEEAEAEAGASDSSVDRTTGDASTEADGETVDARTDVADGDAGGPSTVACDAACSPAQRCVGGSCVDAPPSCRGAGPGAGFDCGGAFGGDDCCASDEVAGGAFFRDYDGMMYTDMSWPARASSYRLDRYEVTVGRFREFVGAVVATGWTPSAGSGVHAHLNGGHGLTNGGSGAVVYETGWDQTWDVYLPKAKSDWDAQLLRCLAEGGYDGRTWTAAAGSNEDLPIDCVSWSQAYAFCIWDGGFLPSDTEWDYAAAGGSNQREYPWGVWAPQQNAMYAIYNCYYPQMLQGNNCQGLANIAPVGSAPAGRAVWGQLDLAGNIYEWTLDHAFASQAPPVPCDDCAQTAVGTQRAIRGGGWDSNDNQILSAVVVASFPEDPPGDVGFRCARSP